VILDLPKVDADRMIGPEPGLFPLRQSVAAIASAPGLLKPMLLTIARPCHGAEKARRRVAGLRDAR
jgi:hypothetical protein